MKKTVYRNYEELPLVLNVREVAAALGIAVANAYELVKSEDFPAFRIGNRICVPKDKFIAWLERQTL